MTSTLFAPQPVHPHVLRFRRPDAPASELDLSAAFERFKLPELLDCSPDTIGEYYTHLRRWRECFEDYFSRLTAAGESWPYRIMHPVLNETSRGELRIFREWLDAQLDRLGRPRFSPRTINKHLGSVQAILRAAEQEDEIDRAYALKPLPTPKARRKLWLTPEQVDAWMDACEVADWPKGLPHAAPTYWRAQGVMYVNYGFRTQELVAYESRKQPLDWSRVFWSPETPHPEGHAVCPWGWFTYIPDKQSRAKPEPLVLPLNETTHHWLRTIADGRTSGPVFPYPFNNDAYYQTWRKILRKSGIKPKPGLDGSEEEYLPLHLRKTSITWLNDHGATIGCPGIAALITGHGDDRSPDALIASAPRSKVQQVHYDCAENRILETLLTLPQPASFRRFPAAAPRLF